MLRAVQIASQVGRDIDFSPNPHLASHRSEAMRSAGYLCDSLRQKQHRALRAPDRTPQCPVAWRLLHKPLGMPVHQLVVGHHHPRADEDAQMMGQTTSFEAYCR
jgi:hypothetical protein